MVIPSYVMQTIGYRGLRNPELIANTGFNVVCRGELEGIDVVLKVRKEHIWDSKLHDVEEEAVAQDAIIQKGGYFANVLDYSHKNRRVPAPHIIFDYVPGKVLATVSNPTVLNESARTKALLRLAQTLYSAHKAGYEIGDLSDGNIIYDPHVLDSELQLIDCGGVFHRSWNKETRPWQVTNGFMAPEQANVTQYQFGKRDVFKFGIIGYMFTTGVNPFVKRTPQLSQLYLQSLSSGSHFPELSKPSAIHGEHANMQADIINDALQINPKDRPDIGSIVSRLQGLLTIPSRQQHPISFSEVGSAQPISSTFLM